MWLEDPEFTGEQWLFLQSGLCPGATSCRKPFQPLLGWTLPSPGPFSHHCLWSPLREGGRRVHAGGWAPSRAWSLHELTSSHNEGVQVQDEAPPPGCPPSFSLHPHTQTLPRIGCRRGLSIPFHLCQVARAQAHSHMGSLFIELLSFPGWPKKKLWPSGQTDLS